MGEDHKIPMRQPCLVATVILLVSLNGGCVLATQKQEFRCPSPPNDERIIVDEAALVNDTRLRWHAIKQRFNEGDFIKFFGPFPAERTRPKEFILNEEDARRLGVNIKIVRTFLTQIPEAWIRNINSITLRDVEMHLTRGYGFSLGPVVGTACNREDGKTDLYFFRNVWSDRETLRVFAHEIAHPNDWSASHRSLEERVNFAYEILVRIGEKDRFMQLSRQYAENFDKMYLWRRAKEYWAEIVWFYFTNRDILPEADLKLVERYLN